MNAIEQRSCSYGERAMERVGFSELRSHKERKLSLATIDKVLTAAKVAPVMRARRPRSRSAL